MQQVAAALDVNYNTVAVWRDRYVEDRLALLEDKARSGRPSHIDGAQRARITALACSSPPEGQARWTLRLLASKAVELDYVEAISHRHVAELITHYRD